MCYKIVTEIIEKRYRYVFYRNENGTYDKIVVPEDATSAVVHKLMGEYGGREPVVLEQYVVSCFEILHHIPVREHFSWGPLAPLDSEDLGDFDGDD